MFKLTDWGKTPVANITSNINSAIMEQTADIIFDRKNIYLVDSISYMLVITRQQLENSRIYRFALKKLIIN